MSAQPEWGPPSSEAVDRARSIVGWYTLAASASGAVPVPASSLAIIANNGFMMAHVSAAIDAPVQWATVVASLGVAGTLNVAGRAVFIEAAKALSWGTGNIWAAVALSAVGAGTAGLQTYVVGLLAIEIARRGGKALTESEGAAILAKAKETYDVFLAEMRTKKISDPGPAPEAQLRSIDGEKKP
jgi:hypothetical protein